MQSNDTNTDSRSEFMKTLSINIKNCYGIRDIETEFDFKKNKASLIYAPNGMMKTSFAKTFRDYSQQITSRDRIYKDREPTRIIQDHTGSDVEPEGIFVIEPYLADYESSRISTLLVGKELKQQYDDILKSIEEKKELLLKELRAQSGVRRGLDDIISNVFTKQEGRLLQAFERIKTEVLEETPSELSKINYTDIFNSKVEDFLRSKEFRDNLDEYTSNYDQLLEKSNYFRRGVFNHYQAGEVAKQLKTHGFFKADHAVYLSSGAEKKEITTEAELEETIKAEMNSILADPKLKESFDKIDAKLKNSDLRAFREFLLNNKNVIPELKTPELLKEKLIKAYVIEHLNLYTNLMDEYSAGKKSIQEITDQATAQATKWQEVINIFNRRFTVPFKVGIENKQDVILKRVTPNITFEFLDEEDNAVRVDRTDLADVLSNGERRALYILNIIFEVEARKEAGIPTLFVIDDIADSFDYKNKYAIVEYLNDILKEGDFRQIILTHNYDFYRTVWKRLELSGSNYHVVKTAAKTSIEAETMYRDPFVKWKKSADKPDKTSMLIALIPFVRNLAEYCGLEEESGLMTSLLHIKSNTKTITIQNLINAFSKILNGQDFSDTPNLEKSVIETIYDEAQKILDNPLDNELETKITLSIAIRLKTEEFLIASISDNEYVSSISKNQTAKLIRKFKEDSEGKSELVETVKTVERVNLMTPENIHLNSFMYEPILDMSAENLSNLYNEVVALTAT